MVATREALLGLLKATQGLAQHVERHPLDYARFSRPQMEYLTRRSRRKMFRVGNRGEKTFCALADVAWRARKAHPYRPDWNSRVGPQHQWIVGVSWAQLIPLMRMFRSFLGRDELRRAPNWTFAKGWGKDSPCLEWPDGSTVTWKTMGQDRAHAGAGLDHALIDEPCDDETYREIERRTVRNAGDLSLSLTPINPPAPLDWLRDMAAEKLVDDLHYPMTEDLFRFADTGELMTLPDGTIMDAAWIEEQAKAVPLRWREIALHGGWDEVVTDGEFTEVFSPAKHVHDFTLDGKEVICLGIDHGTKAYTETAVLVAVDERTEYPSVYVIDCYEARENSTPEQDAREILALLRRHGGDWRAPWLRRVVGDIPHFGGRGKHSRKSNQELAYELAKELQLARHEALNPPIWQARSGRGSNPRGSIMRRISWLHRALLRDGQVTIHPRCKSLVEAFEKFRGGSDDPHGHLIDALCYALDYYISRGQTRYVPPPTLRF